MLWTGLESFLQIKTQQVETDRLSGELDTQTIPDSQSVCAWWALNFQTIFEPAACGDMAFRWDPPK